MTPSNPAEPLVSITHLLEMLNAATGQFCLALSHESQDIASAGTLGNSADALTWFHQGPFHDILDRSPVPPDEMPLKQIQRANEGAILQFGYLTNAGAERVLEVQSIPLPEADCTIVMARDSALSAVRLVHAAPRPDPNFLHELGNIFAIGRFAMNGLRAGAEPQKAARNLAELSGAIERGAALLATANEDAKASAEKQSSQLDLTPIVTQTVETFRRVLPESVELDLVISGNAVVRATEAIEIEAAVFEMLSAARRVLVDTGPIRGQITVRQHSTKSTVNLIVSVMSPAKGSPLLEARLPFFESCRKLAALSGGAFAQSALDGALTLTLRLPRTTSTANSGIRALNEADNSLDGYRIALAPSSFELSLLLSEILTHHGATVETLTSKDHLEQFLSQSAPVDVVLTSRHLPDQSEVADIVDLVSLKKSRARLVVMTADTSALASVREHATVLLQPVNTAVLINSIRLRPPLAR